MTATHVLALFASLPALVLAQYSVQRLETRSHQDERETGQTGGLGLGQYTNLLDLRCQRPGDALVGVRVSRGTVLDYVQVLCAPVRCTGSRCAWSKAYWGASAGNLAGGLSLPPMVCKTSQAVSGYRGAARSINFFDYITDLSIQCGTVTGPPRGRAQRTFPIGPPYTWLHPEGHLSAERGKLTGPFTCDRYSATAVSTATGRYRGLGTVRVVQALSLYCGWPGRENPAEPCPPGTLYLGNNSEGRPVCQPCVAASSSRHPVTGAADRHLAALPVDRFNCHYYSLVHINYTAGRTVRSPVLYERERGFGAELPLAQECLKDDDLRAGGYRLVQSGIINPAGLQAGDIVTVGLRGLDSIQCKYAHSAVVIQANASPQLLMLRQKPNPDDCIVDYSWTNFSMLYRLQEAVAFVWRRGAASGPAAACGRTGSCAALAIPESASSR